MIEAAPAWWQRRRFVVLAMAIAALPLVWPTIPPLTDLPGHIARYRVELDRGAHPWLGEWYAFRWAVIGNLGVDLLVIPLAKPFGLELAVKLIVLAIPALTAGGLLWIAREVHGRVPPTALFALPLAYGYPFQFGFVNFALSMALTLNAFALWLRLARTGRLRLRAALFAPLAVLIWLCHAFGWGVLGLLAFAAELWRLRGEGRGWVRAALGAGLACLVLALPLAMMVAWRQGAQAGTGDWFDWPTKLEWLLMVLRDRWAGWDVASALILAALALLPLVERRLRYDPMLATAALFLAAAFVLLPRIVFASAYADMRLAPFLLAIAVVAVAPAAPMRPRDAALVALAGAAFFGARIAATTASYALYDRSYARELAAVPHLPVGARVIAFVGAHCYPAWGDGRQAHLPSLALVRRYAFADDAWAIDGSQLMTPRNPSASGFDHDPVQLVTPRHCDEEPWLTIDRALASFPRDAFDYLWLIDPPAHDPRATDGLTVVWRSGNSVLLRMRTPGLSDTGAAH